MFRLVKTDLSERQAAKLSGLKYTTARNILAREARLQAKNVTHTQSEAPSTELSKESPEACQVSPEAPELPPNPTQLAHGQNPRKKALIVTNNYS